LEVAVSSTSSGRRPPSDLERSRVPYVLVILGLVAAANVAAVVLSLFVA
jgi:hypothetical protein